MTILPYRRWFLLAPLTHAYQRKELIHFRVHPWVLRDHDCPFLLFKRININWKMFKFQSRFLLHSVCTSISAFSTKIKHVGFFSWSSVIAVKSISSVFTFNIILYYKSFFLWTKNTLKSWKSLNTYSGIQIWEKKHEILKRFFKSFNLKLNLQLINNE